MKVIENDGENLAKVLWYYNLVPEVITLKQKIICPFHNDLNPSMQVDFEKGFCYCHGCGMSVGAKDFVKEMEKKYNGLNDLQAYRKYIDILKSDKCSDITIDKASVKHRAPQRQLYDEAYDYYHGLKTVNWRDSDESEVIETKQYMKNRGFYPLTLHKCKAKVTYNKSYSIIFPMLDNGKFKGWVCRTTLKSIEKKRKYLYNEGFSRATTLVGSYGDKDYVFVVEGYMDRLKFFQNGEDNVVAILGWKMSQQQIQKLKQKGIKRIISALDNDTYGKKGTEYLKNYFQVTRFAYLKGVKDPGEMTKELFDKMYSKTMSRYKEETR